MKIIFGIFNLLNLMVYISNSTIEEVYAGIKEVAYSYYMRSKNLQYSVPKKSWITPEDSTQQNIKYTSCSFFVENVYKDIFEEYIPSACMYFLSYAEQYVGEPEIIAYSYLKEDKSREMKVYSPDKKNKYEIIKNPTINDIIPLVQIGDILTHNDHVFIIYDVVKDKNGKVIEAIYMESMYGLGGSYVSSKIPRERIKLSNGEVIIFGNFALYLNSKLNKGFEEGLVEGSLHFNNLSISIQWVNLNLSSNEKEYAIIRIINKDSNGNAIIKCKDLNKYNYKIHHDDIINLSDKIIDRSQKFRHLFIEKIVNKNNNNIVEIGDILNYKIIIKNNYNQDYNYDLIITENLSKYITYDIHYENKEIISFNYDRNNKKLIWNIGKLKKGEEIIINYIVKVTSGKPKDVIESTGYVNNIPSSVVRNIIGININKKKQELIKENFEKLKKEYSGKKLINEIYKETFDKDIKFDEFDITNLIKINTLNSTKSDSLSLNKNNGFYGAILDNYWSALASIKHTYINGGEEVNIHNLKMFERTYSPERRQDYIYKETLKTGDILIYRNNKDIRYSIDTNKNKLNKKYITYEEGEYAYIYIENKGFVGINLGDDGKENTKDDRNEFNAKYYKDNNLTLYELATNVNDEMLEIVNLQTLFGKDYYVILRPSLCFDFSDNNKTGIIIFIVILCIFILVCVILLICKYIKIKRDGKEFNITSLKQELIFKYKLGK